MFINVLGIMTNAEFVLIYLVAMVKMALIVIWMLSNVAPQMFFIRKGLIAMMNKVFLFLSNFSV